MGWGESVYKRDLRKYFLVEEGGGNMPQKKHTRISFPALSTLQYVRRLFLNLNDPMGRILVVELLSGVETANSCT